MLTGPWRDRHPFLLVAALEVTVIGVYLILFAIIRRSGLDTLVMDTAANLILAGIAALLFTRWRWWGESGFRPPFHWTMLALFWLPALVLLASLPGPITTSNPVRIAGFFIIALLVGFAEEAFYRGLMLRALLPKGIWTAAIVSALLFGLSHAINILFGANPQAVLLQIVYAGVIFGFASAALVIRTGTIVPLVVLHFLIDLVAFLHQNNTIQTTGITASDVFVTVVGSGIALVYGAGLLIWARRRSNPSPLPLSS